MSILKGHQSTSALVSSVVRERVPRGLIPSCKSHKAQRHASQDFLRFCASLYVSHHLHTKQAPFDMKRLFRCCIPLLDSHYNRKPLPNTKPSILTVGPRPKALHKKEPQALSSGCGGLPWLDSVSGQVPWVSGRWGGSVEVQGSASQTVECGTKGLRPSHRPNMGHRSMTLWQQSTNVMLVVRAKKISWGQLQRVSTS